MNVDDSLLLQIKALLFVEVSGEKKKKHLPVLIKTEPITPCL